MKIVDSAKLNSDLAYDELIRRGEDWADKDAAATILEETKKSVLARLMNTGNGSVAAREMLALADRDYLDHLDIMVEARRMATRARVRYDAAKTLAEMRRSEESTRRAEMTLR